MFTLDLNSKPAQYDLIRAALLRLLQQYPSLYPSGHFILGVESRDKLFLTTLMTIAWDLPIALFPLNPDLPEGYKKALLRQTGCRLLLSDDDLCESLPQRFSRSDFLLLAQFGEIDYSADLSANSIKLIIATSGTTDFPKAVCLSRENIQAHVEASNQRIPLGVSDAWLNCLPLFHIGGAVIIYRCLLSGCKVQIWDKFQVEQIMQTLKGNTITHISLVPTMLQKLLHTDVGVSPSKTLKAALIGGSALSEKLYEQAVKQQWPLCVSYGSSESCSHIATSCQLAGKYQAGLTGRSLTNVEIAIEKSAIQSPVGQIKMRGAMIMSGYAQSDYSLGSGLQDGWFISQDLGHIDQNGRLVILGRIDDVINSGGEVIHPQIVEHELERCPGIVDAAVFGEADEMWGEKLVLAYCGSWTENQVRSWCDEKLALSFKIRAIIKKERLPRNHLGKIQRSKLQTLD